MKPPTSTDAAWAACREAHQAYEATVAVWESQRSQVRIYEAAPRYGDSNWDARLDAAREALDAAETAMLDAHERGLVLCSIAQVWVEQDEREKAAA